MEVSISEVSHTSSGRLFEMDDISPRNLVLSVGSGKMPISQAFSIRNRLNFDIRSEIDCSLCI